MPSSNLNFTTSGLIVEVKWRHNNILSYIYRHLKSSISESDKLFCDLEGHNIGFTTVPLNCSVTNLIPDLCLLSDSDEETKLLILELTVPFELNIQNAHKRKNNKYASLVDDIESNNVQTDFIALEIGSRGFIDSDNMKRLKNLYEYIDSSKLSFKDFKNTISKLAIVSSFVIFSARNDPTWNNVDLLSV